MSAGLPFPYDGPAEWAEPVAAALRRVVDPEVALDVVDIGLVYGVHVQDRRVRVALTMTSAACPVAEVVCDDARAELAAVLPPGWAVAVDLVWEPAWTPQRMSPRARQLMGW